MERKRRPRVEIPEAVDSFIHNIGIQVDYEDKELVLEPESLLSDTSCMICNDVPIYPIFNVGENRDIYNNPLSLALNNTDGWKISDYKLETYIRSRLIKHINSETTIISQTKSPYSKYICSLAKKIFVDVIIYNHLLYSMAVEYISEYFCDYTYLFEWWVRRDYGEDALDRFYGYLNKMETDNNNVFSYQMIPEKFMITLIDRALQFDDPLKMKGGWQINNRKVVIFDDILLRRNRIESVIKELKQNYIPREISVISMFG